MVRVVVVINAPYPSLSLKNRTKERKANHDPLTQWLYQITHLQSVKSQGWGGLQVGVGLLDKGSANGQWWLDSIGSVIGEGKEFERLASRQLAGLLIGVWWVLNMSNMVTICMNSLLRKKHLEYYFRLTAPEVGVQ